MRQPLLWGWIIALNCGLKKNSIKLYKNVRLLFANRFSLPYLSKMFFTPRKIENHTEYYLIVAYAKECCIECIWSISVLDIPYWS